MLEGDGDVVVVGRGLAGQAEPSLALVLAVVSTQMLLKLTLLEIMGPHIISTTEFKFQPIRFAEKFT